MAGERPSGESGEERREMLQRARAIFAEIFPNSPIDQTEKVVSCNFFGSILEYCPEEDGLTVLLNITLRGQPTELLASLFRHMVKQERSLSSNRYTQLQAPESAGMFTREFEKEVSFAELRSELNFLRVSLPMTVFNKAKKKILPA